MSRLLLAAAYLFSLASPVLSAGHVARPVTSIQTPGGLRLSATQGVLLQKRRLSNVLESNHRRPLAARSSLTQMTQAQPGLSLAAVTSMAFDAAGPSGPAGGAVAAAAPSMSETEVIVEAPAQMGFAPGTVTEDLAVGFGGTDVEERLAAQSAAIGLPVDGRGFNSFNAKPVGSIKLINTMIYHADSSIQAQLIADLISRGYKAKAGKVYHLPEPTAPAAPRTIGLKEAAKIIGSDRLQTEIEKVIGAPKMPGEAEAPQSFWEKTKQFFRRTFMAVAPSNPVIPWALVDTYMKSDTHPYLKGRFINEIGGTPDGQIHGFHVAGITVGMDRHNFTGHAFNIFPKGSATEGDILMKVNMAVAKFGVAITGNSWGDSEGKLSDRFMKNGEQGDLILNLMEKQALEMGVHHSISAGNQGSGANTIGGPAVGTAQVPVKINGKLIGMIDRIQAIAAADSEKMIAPFSSVGRSSPWVAANDKDGRFKDYPRRPLRTAVGVNLISSVPPGSGSNNAELGGPGRPLSGTSMSRPQDHGAKMQLARGIMVLLGDYLPKISDAKENLTFVLDLAEWAMQKAAVKHRTDSDFENKYGNGFDDVWAAFELSAATLKAAAAPSVGRWARELTRKLMGFGGFGDHLVNSITFDAERGVQFVKP